MLLVQAYETLSSPEMRNTYNQQLQVALIDAMDDYNGKPFSKWLVGHRLGKNEDPSEDRGVFVVSQLKFAPYVKLKPLKQPHAIY